MKFNEPLTLEGDLHQAHTRPKYKKPEKFIQKEIGARATQTASPATPPFIPVDLPSKNISMTLVVLDPGQLTELVRHTYEVMLYVLEGKGYTEIEGEEVEWQTGDALYIPNWAWHCHQNLDTSNPAKFISCDNYLQLHQLGLALKEVEGKNTGHFT